MAKHGLNLHVVVFVYNKTVKSVNISWKSQECVQKKWASVRVEFCGRRKEVPDTSKDC